MLAGRYADPLVVSGAFGGRLRILGRAARVQSLRLESTRYVTVGPLKVTPLTGDALLQVSASRNILLRDLTVTARGTRWSAGVDIPDSSWVTVQQSEFTHCGDRSPNWVNCLRVQQESSHVLVDHDWFHDCLGCDFLHGRIGSYLTVSSSRFERTPALQPRGHRPAASPSEPRALRVGALQAPGPDRALRGRRPALRPELLRRLQGRRRAAVRHRRVTPDADRQQRLPRDRPARARGGSRRSACSSAEARAARSRPTSASSTTRSTPARPARTATPRRSASAPATAGGSPRAQRPVIAHNVIGLLETPSRLCNGANADRQRHLARNRLSEPVERVPLVVVDTRQVRASRRGKRSSSTTIQCAP